MATAQTKRVPNAPVYGSLAYDLDFMAREHALQHAGERVLEQPRPAAVPRQTPRTETRVRTRTAQRLDPVPVLGCLAAAVMLVMVLVIYVNLNVVAAETVALNQQLTDLQSSHDVLLADYERTFDMETVKAAAAAAGMSKPSKSQIFYTDLSGADAAILFQEPGDSALETLFSSLGQGVLTAVEYFR